MKALPKPGQVARCVAARQHDVVLASDLVFTRSSGLCWLLRHQITVDGPPPQPLSQLSEDNNLAVIAGGLSDEDLDIVAKAPRYTADRIARLIGEVRAAEDQLARLGITLRRRSTNGR